MENNLITYLLALPLAGSMIILYIRKDYVIRYTGLFFSFAVFVLSLIMYFKFDPAIDGFQFFYKTPWIGNLNISYQVGIDGLSMLLVLLTTFLTSI